MELFATVQNKLHFSIHSHTAAEVIVKRADAEKEHMGFTTWRNALNGKIVKSKYLVIFHSDQEAINAGYRKAKR